MKNTEVEIAEIGWMPKDFGFKAMVMVIATVTDIKFLE